MKRIEIPTHCPACGTKLKVESVDLKCDNIDCPKQIMLKLVAFIKRIGIKGVSEKSINKFGINNFYDLVEWKPNEKYKNETKFYKELKDKVFTSTPEELFSCMVFDGVGKATVIKLLDMYSITDIVDNHNISTLPDSVGELTMDSLHKHAGDNYEHVILIMDDVRFTLKDEAPKVQGGVLDGLSFCCTGKLENMSRDELYTVVTDNGGETRTSVSGKLSYLVNNDTLSQTGKNKKAQKLGIPIISETEFLNMVSVIDNEICDIFAL